MTDTFAPAAFPSAPVKKSHRKRNVIVLGVASIGLVIGLATTLSGGGNASTLSQYENVAPPTQSPSESATGFYNMNNLASDFTNQYNSQPGPTISDVSCISTGVQTATCLGTLDDGTQYGQTVQISTDGTGWVSLAPNSNS